MALVVLVAGLGWLVRHVVRHPTDPFSAAAAAVAIFVLANKVYSPTYDVWLVVFFVMVPFSRRLWLTFCAVDLAIFVTVYGYFHQLHGAALVRTLLPALVAVRTVTLLVVIGQATRTAREPNRHPAAGSAGAFRRRPRPMTSTTTRRVARTMLNKVPEVTVYFWIIKILATTVGETAADFLATNLGPGPDQHDLRDERVLLVVALVFQFRRVRYVPFVYWLAVVLISIVGTLITDNLIDNSACALQMTTTVFAIALAVTFARVVRAASGRCRSTRSTRRGARRSTGSPSCSRSRSAPPPVTYLAETSRTSATGSRRCCSAAAIARGRVRALRSSAWTLILAFWMAYILTRPLGASLGDYLSQPAPTAGSGSGRPSTSVRCSWLRSSAWWCT